MEAVVAVPNTLVALCLNEGERSAQSVHSVGGVATVVGPRMAGCGCGCGWREATGRGVLWQLPLVLGSPTVR